MTLSRELQPSEIRPEPSGACPDPSGIVAGLAEEKILRQIAHVARKTGLRAYVVGGFVRDHFLAKKVKDIDFVVEGGGIKFARAVAKYLRTSDIAVYKKFGTALVRHNDFALEFVGARKESYRGDSRKPEVEPADLLTDLSRRDFTINAMAVSLNKDDFLSLLDPFDGKADLAAGLLRTPLDPKITFHDDPLRILRGIRFATQLQFRLHEQTLQAMAEMHDRLKIISQERITDEFLKIVAAPVPSTGFKLMDETKVLGLIFPEFVALKGVDEKDGHFHKDVFYHTLKVLDNVASVSDKIELRLAAIFHDIAKPRTKEFVEGKGWSFHGHEEIGARMLPAIFRRFRLPNDRLKYVQKLTRLHLRPIALTEEDCTDSAYRRLLFQAGEELEDLLTLCRADITSRNEKRRRQHLKNFDFVVKRLNEVEAKDKMRAFQSPVRGDEIMQVLNIAPGPLVGKIKSQIEEAILDGVIPNESEAARAFLLEIAGRMGGCDTL
jgi:putative nucleotidyltransferase with HDIG domain